VLGHNYPSSTWYKDALTLLQKVGLEPKVNSASPLAASLQG
jgi:outer membrane protein assembly factor BamD